MTSQKSWCKHLVECHCVLPQMRQRKEIIYHKFIVFSTIDLDSNVVIPKHAACNNCGVIHNVIDICKSEIYGGKEVGATISKEDIMLMIPKEISNVLQNYNCELHDWEHVLHIFQNNLWIVEDCFIVLSRESDEDSVSGKLLRITGSSAFRIEPYMYNTMVKK